MKKRYIVRFVGTKETKFIEVEAESSKAAMFIALPTDLGPKFLLDDIYVYDCNKFEQHLDLSEV